MQVWLALPKFHLAVLTDAHNDWAQLFELFGFSSLHTHHAREKSAFMYVPCQCESRWHIISGNLWSKSRNGTENILEWATAMLEIWDWQSQETRKLQCLSSLIIMKLLALTFWTGSKSCFGIVLCLYTEIELKLRIFMGVLFTWPMGWPSSSWIILWIPLNFGKGTCLPAYIHSHHVYKSKQHDKTDEYVIATSFHAQHFSALQIHVLTNTGSGLEMLSQNFNLFSYLWWWYHHTWLFDIHKMFGVVISSNMWPCIDKAKSNNIQCTHAMGHEYYFALAW